MHHALLSGMQQDGGSVFVQPAFDPEVFSVVINRGRARLVYGAVVTPTETSNFASLLSLDNTPQALRRASTA